MSEKRSIRCWFKDSQLLFGTLLFAVLLWQSCKNKEAEVPSYLYVDHFTLTTDFQTQGHNSHRFTDVWVYVNNTFAGVYELPARVPLVNSGTTVIQLFPGVRENGSTSNRVVNRLYNGHTVTLDLVPGKMDTIVPVTSFRSNANLVWIEDYEINAITTKRSNNSTSTDSLKLITLPDTNVFEPGANSQFTGYINMGTTTTGEIFEHITTSDFILPGAGEDVWLEMNYKGNTPFQVGIYAYKVDVIEQIPILYVFTKQDWNKIYINLKSETSALPTNTKVKLFFGILNTGEDPDFVPQLYLDNIKLGFLN